MRWHYHFLFWLVYWLVNAFVSSRYDYQFFTALWSELFQLPVKIAVVYAVFALPEPFHTIRQSGRFFLPEADRDKSLWRDISTLKWLSYVTGLIVVAGMLNRIVMHQFIIPIWYPALAKRVKLWHLYGSLIVILDIAFVVSLTLAIRYGRRFIRLRQREQSLIIEKTAAELKALRAQTNPHFLFNTLTNIYVMSRRNAPETPDIVLRLSNLLRYMLYDCSADRVPIQLEFKMLQEYLELEKIRFGQRLNLVSEFSADNPEQEIAPLLLLPFVENAFKHGAAQSRFNPEIFIHCQLTGQTLDLKVENTFDAPLEQERRSRPGIGLENAHKQLDLLYPGKYLLDTHVENQRFIVHLTLQVA